MPRNPKALERGVPPSIFIGSSTEGREIAEVIQLNLDEHAECTIWNQGIFNLSQTTLNSLLAALWSSDFGIFVLSPDDIVQMRGESYSTARDNVIFELGLFIGGLGLERTFFLIPSDAPALRLPTNLDGVTSGMYNLDRKDRNKAAALGPVCTKIRMQIEDLTAVNQGGAQASERSELPSDTSTARTSVLSDKPPLEGAGITATKHKDGYILKGNTQAWAKVIRAAGASWKFPQKIWLIDEERLSMLERQLPGITRDL